jgi:hypothetical protein
MSISFSTLDRQHPQISKGDEPILDLEDMHQSKPATLDEVSSVCLLT